MLLLLDCLLSAIFKLPLDCLRLIACSLDFLAVLEGGPEVVELWELDQMPDLGDVSWDEGAFVDGRRGGDDGGRHACEWVFACGFVCDSVRSYPTSKDFTFE